MAEKLKEKGSGLDEASVKKYFRSLLSAIHYCLKVQDFSHRDIKPENIMLDSKGEVHLADFGCSEFFEPTNEKLSLQTKGTYLFMAPEMFEGNKAIKVVNGSPIDIWASGVTLFNLLTNRYPWEGDFFSLIEKVKTQPPNLEPLGEDRADLIDLFEKVFVKNPRDRINIYDLLDHPWLNDNFENPVELHLEEGTTVDHGS